MMTMMHRAIEKLRTWLKGSGAVRPTYEFRGPLTDDENAAVRDKIAYESVKELHSKGVVAWVWGVNDSVWQAVPPPGKSLCPKCQGRGKDREWFMEQCKCCDGKGCA